MRTFEVRAILLVLAYVLVILEWVLLVRLANDAYAVADSLDALHDAGVMLWTTGELSWSEAPETPAHCAAVETEWGACIESGHYEGDPVLLFGHRPIIRKGAQVRIDARGQVAREMGCAEGAPDGAHCFEDLPRGTLGIDVVPYAEPRCP